MAVRLSKVLFLVNKAPRTYKQRGLMQLKECWNQRLQPFHISAALSANNHNSHEILLQRQQSTTNASSEETSEYFKMAMRKVPQQVVVVTSSLYNPKTEVWLKRGVTCSSFSSVSINPPIISFCLNQGSRMHDVIRATRKFAVHILSQDQIHQGIHFSMPAEEDVCQFNNVPHVQGEELFHLFKKFGGHSMPSILIQSSFTALVHLHSRHSHDSLPILLGSLAVLICNAHSYHGVGDHTVWYGNVDGVSVSEALQEPLIYFTRKFRSVGDEIFLKAFEDTTLPFEDWTHEAHLRMAWNYITDHGKEGAVPYIKLGIQKFNEKNKDKIKTGYHETITMFFIHLVSDAIVQSVKAKETFEEFLLENRHLMNQDLLLQYYNKETLFSPDARYQFILPDKRDLP